MGYGGLRRAHRTSPSNQGQRRTQLLATWEGSESGQSLARRCHVNLWQICPVEDADPDFGCSLCVWDDSQLLSHERICIFCINTVWILKDFWWKCLIAKWKFNLNCWFQLKVGKHKENISRKKLKWSDRWWTESKEFPQVEKQKNTKKFVVKQLKQKNEQLKIVKNCRKIWN